MSAQRENVGRVVRKARIRSKMSHRCANNNKSRGGDSQHLRVFKNQRPK